MEQFTLLEGDHTLKDSRELINNSLLTVRSLSAGDAFPTENLSEGMLCYRTDLRRLYCLADAAGEVWTDKLPADLGGTASAVPWEGITDKPTAYPAADHSHLYAGASEAGGAAASADKLTTPRTINGTAFDGTSDITIVNTVEQGGTGATTAANARDNLGLATAVTAASVSGTTITLTFADGTTATLTTQDTAPFTARATSIGGASTTKPAVVTTTYKSGTNWYKVWSDGFIEQGGQTASSSGSTARTVTFPKAFTNANYMLVVGSGNGGNTDKRRYNNLQWTTKTTTNFTAISEAGESIIMDWYACGN